MKRPLGRAGQIVIPALLLFPTLFLFVYLIYETAKLSREKIRHQFAVDAAAFVEATNYSDFLNRTAYVNGAFPMRIFQQGYDGFEAPGKSEDNNTDYGEVLFKNGIYPRSKSGRQKIEFTDEDVWDIAYSDTPPESAARNAEDPTVPDTIMLFTMENANKLFHPWELASEVFKLYIQVYTLLGSVEHAQLEVLERLTKGNPSHSFLRKSYWLNTGDPDTGELATSFDSALGTFKTEAHCSRFIVYHGNKWLTVPGNYQKYEVQKNDPPFPLPPSPGCANNGMFQMQTVEKTALNNFKAVSQQGYPGLSLTTRWQLPAGNYFNVDFSNLFPNGAPTLHTTISVGATNPNAKVWPNPTPKFQVRQYP